MAKRMKIAATHEAQIPINGTTLDALHAFIANLRTQHGGGTVVRGVYPLLDVRLDVPEPPKPKRRSRPQQWADAVGAVRDAHGELENALSAVEDAFSEVRSVQEEYESWKDNTPDSLQQSPLYEKLEAVCDLDFQQDPRDMSASDIEALIDEAEGIDLPMGFGKD